MKKDNIENIYSELEGYSKAPPTELWDNIESRLHPEKKKRRGAFFLWGSAAAILLVLLGYFAKSGLPSLNDKPTNKTTDIEHSVDTINKQKLENSSTDNNAIVGVDASSEKQNQQREPSQNTVDQDASSKSDEILNGKEESVKLTKNEPLRDKKLKNKSYVQNFNRINNEKPSDKAFLVLQLKNENVIGFLNENVVADIDAIFLTKHAPSIDLTKELIVLYEDYSDSLNLKKEYKEWSVEVLGGVSSTASKSFIQNTSISTSPQNDFVYALKVGYAITDKLAVKSGVGKNVLGQEIDNILFASSDASLSAETENIISNQDIQILVSEGSFSDIEVSAEDINQGNLQQQLDYIQLPLELSYNLISESKYNVSLGVGGNVNFLTNNRAYLDGEQIGESLDVNTTIFGATLNSNISYKLTKAMNLFVEPSYNYFQKPIDNGNQNFKNTQFRALFGLRYRF